MWMSLSWGLETAGREATVATALEPISSSCLDHTMSLPRLYSEWPGSQWLLPTLHELSKATHVCLCPMLGDCLIPLAQPALRPSLCGKPVERPAPWTRLSRATSLWLCTLPLRRPSGTSAFCRPSGCKGQVSPAPLPTLALPSAPISPLANPHRPPTGPQPAFCHADPTGTKGSPSPSDSLSCPSSPAPSPSSPC